MYRYFCFSVRHYLCCSASTEYARAVGPADGSSAVAARGGEEVLRNMASDHCDCTQPQCLPPRLQATMSDSGPTAIRRTAPCCAADPWREPPGYSAQHGASRLATPYNRARQYVRRLTRPMTKRSKFLIHARRLHNALRHSIENMDTAPQNLATERPLFEHFASGMYLAGILAFLRASTERRRV